MGFCRTNLFKRLESSGQAFLQSVERHILRNYIYLHAIENSLPIPIGTQDAELLDPGVADDEDTSMFAEEENEDNGGTNPPAATTTLRTHADFTKRAAEIYGTYAGVWKKRFKWLRPGLFIDQLAEDLRDDDKALLKLLALCGAWDPKKDAKLISLVNLLVKKHPGEKALIFTQFADTVNYLVGQLKEQGITKIAGASGDVANPTALAWRFSPVSNEKRSQITLDQELRVLVATDVLSEGQNLQDGAIVVNFDLPWAIIRLVQRAGRVDRIGQQAENILCYSFLPADGVNRIIGLRERVRQRLSANAEVLGTDEAFFEGEPLNRLHDLFTEKAGILDGDAEGDVDLASYALQIWKNAVNADPSLQKTIPELPPVVFATKSHQPAESQPAGVLVYLRTPEGNDALAWMNTAGQSATESQFAILRAAECTPETPALPRQENHHQLVQTAVQLILNEEKSVGGQLGRPSGGSLPHLCAAEAIRGRHERHTFRDAEAPQGH